MNARSLGSRDRRHGGTLAIFTMAGAIAVALVVVASFSLVRGIEVGARRAYEPQSFAEERCLSLAPVDGVDSAEWDRCVAGELRVSPFGAGLAWFARSALFLAGGATIAIGGTMLNRRFISDPGDRPGILAGKA